MVLIDNIDEKRYEINVKGSKKDVRVLVLLIEENLRKNAKVDEIKELFSILDKKKQEEVVIDFSSIARLKLRNDSFLFVPIASNPQFYFSTVKKYYKDAKKLFDEKKNKVSL